ncbi:carbon storage regulator [Pseudomonas phytophila]|uniref:Carbon storage regulator n=1 Tax=Pseudomonas phytophila TaxID=2867264 RepID=A0ABY6FH61_9PSED|nr:carbon storage regulator [Pseudomonas phytophila]
MLILTRRQGESIVINDEIQFQVLSVSEATGDVRIQIEAPELLAVVCVRPSHLPSPEKPRHGVHLN